MTAMGSAVAVMTCAAAATIRSRPATAGRVTLASDAPTSQTDASALLAGTTTATAGAVTAMDSAHPVMDRRQRRWKEALSTASAPSAVKEFVSLRSLRIRVARFAGNALKPI